MWLWIFLILFFLIAVISSVIVFYSLRRITQYEQLLINVSSIINYSNERLKTIDSKGSFESDDEIGFFFKEVQKIQNMMDDVFENEEEADE